VGSNMARDETGEIRTNGNANGAGCVLIMLTINVLLMGLLSFSFSHGPYSSPEQETWYRYGSIGFLLAGAVLPAIAFWLGARRTQWAVVALTVWMFAALIAWFGYALLSGGGM